MSTEEKSMSIIVTKGSLDWAYPPFILATTAAAMGLPVTMFFTFYGLPLLLKKLDLQVTAAGNPAMKMPMMGMHMGLPNLLTAVPGVDAACSVMMKNLIKKKGVASVEELRDLAVEAEVTMIGCQMTMDLFEYSLDDLARTISGYTWVLFRVASVYVVVLWILVQGAIDLFPVFGLPDWSIRLLVVIGVVGFPIAVLLAWGTVAAHAIRIARANPVMALRYE